MARLGTDPIVEWLLRSDPAVAYQARRDLLDEDDLSARALIAQSGTAAAILAARRPDGHWGRGFYQPKWTSTHYTLLELRDHQIDPDVAACREAVALCLDQKGQDGGVNPSGNVAHSDVCINGMFLAVAAYFGARTPDLTSLVDFIVSEQVGDGGFNCRSNRAGCQVSSVHTTSSVIDGLTAYLRAGHPHRADAVAAARGAAIECLLARRLYQKRATGVPVHPEVIKLHHPPRWHFDVLRGLEVVTAAGVTHDERLQPALEVLRRRRRPDGWWAANAGYSGATHVTYARAGRPNPWITLRARRHARPPRPVRRGTTWTTLGPLPRARAAVTTMAGRRAPASLAAGAPRWSSTTSPGVSIEPRCLSLGELCREVRAMAVLAEGADGLAHGLIDRFRAVRPPNESPVRGSSDADRLVSPSPQPYVVDGEVYTRHG